MTSSTSKVLQVWVWVWVLVSVNVLAICIAQDYTFVVEESDHNLLCTNVTTIKVNGTIPGPALNLTRGQTVTVNVINNANHGLTIHWHGVKQPRNPWSDGPEYITQCPIKPGTNFTYQIILSDEEGTLWWHAHSDWTRATVYGAISIHPSDVRPRPYHIDGEQEILLGTWFDTEVMGFVDAYRQNGTNLPMQFAALTINGLPGHLYLNDVGCTPGMFEMEVEPNKIYLLRVVNAAMNEELAFAVAGHNLTVVGTDAAYIDPISNRDHIMITSGQTMDVLLVTNQSPDNYYMEAQFVGFDGTRSTTGLVKYSNAATPTPTPPRPDLPDDMDVANFTGQFRALNDSNYPIDVPQTVDTNIFMTVSITSQACDANQPCTDKSGDSLSNITFVTPGVDVLQAYYLNMSSVYKTDFPLTAPAFDYTNVSGSVGSFSDVNGTRVFVVDYNSTVQMVFQGTNIQVPQGVAHPIHLHGQSFYSVAWDHGNFNASNVTYNTQNPPLINTVALPANGWTAIRFRAHNPGVWFMHCHLDRHAFSGMDTVMIVRNGTTTDTSMLPPPYTPTGTCS